MDIFFQILLLVFFIIAGAAVLVVGFSLLCFTVCIVRSRSLDLSDERMTRHTMFAKITPIVKKALLWINMQEFETVSITSRDGLKLAGKFLKAEPAAGTAILVHGYRSIAANDFSSAIRPYHEKGFNILLIDQRAHNGSEGRYITFGINESEDVSRWAEYIHQRMPGLPIILAGISMGAASVLMSTRFNLPAEVKGIVADCGFTSPKDVIRFTIRKEAHLPPDLIFPLIDFWGRHLAKVDLSSVSTIEVLKKNTIPILLIHGKADRRVPCSMTEQNFEACKGYREMVLVEKANHAVSFFVDPERVLNALEAFLRKCLNKEEFPEMEINNQSKKDGTE
jgi:fermentation-respiration switch protein FrsA (DUF1100 family)